MVTASRPTPAQLAESVYPWVWGLVNRRLPARSPDRDDVVQDVAVRMLRSARTYDPDRGPVTVWAKWQLHSVLSQRRISYARRVHPVPLDPENEPADRRQADALQRRESADHARTRLDPLLPVLTNRERYVIARRFSLGGNTPARLQQVGAELGLTRERVRQIECSGLARMRREADRLGVGVG